MPGLTFQDCFLLPREGPCSRRALPNICRATVSNPGANLGLQWIHNFSPTTINEARISWMRAGADAHVLGHGTNYGDQIGIPNANVDDINSGFPTQNIAGLSQMGEAGAYPLITIENCVPSSRQRHDGSWIPHFQVRDGHQNADGRRSSSFWAATREVVSPITNS